MKTVSLRCLVLLLLVPALLSPLAGCNPNPIVPHTPTPGVTATELLYTASEAIVTVAAGPAGDVYAVTLAGSVLKISATGEAQTLYTGLRTCSFSASALAVLPDGSVVVNDCVNTKDTLVRLAASGGKTTLATLEESVRALAADASGNLYAGTWTSQGDLSVNFEPTNYLAGADDLAGHVWKVAQDGQLERLYEGGIPLALGVDAGGALYAAVWGQKGPFDPESRSYTLCGPKNHFWIALSDRVAVAQLLPKVKEVASPGRLDAVMYVVPGKAGLLAYGRSASGTCGIFRLQEGQELRQVVLDRSDLVKDLTGLVASGSFLFAADRDGHVYRMSQDSLALGPVGQALAQGPTAAPPVQKVVPPVTVPSTAAPSSAPTAAPAPTGAPTAAPAPTRTPLPPPPTAAPSLSVRVTQETLIEDIDARHVAWSPDGAILAVAGSDIALFDARTAQQTYSLDIAWADAVAFSPDGTLLASASYDGVKVWQVDGWAEVRTLAGSQDTNSLAFSPDGTLLATGTGGVVKLWEVASGKDLRTSPLTSYSRVNAVAFSPNGQVLVGAGGDVLKSWAVSSGEELSSQEQPHTIDGIAFSPDGVYLAVSLENSGAVSLLNAADGRQVRTLSGHDLQVRDLSFSPHDQLLAVSSGVQVKVWDLDGGTVVATLTGHSQQVESVAFSPDGTTLATGASDLRLWKVEVGPAGAEPTAAASPVPATAAPRPTSLPLSARAITPDNAAQVASTGLLDLGWTSQRLLFTPDGKYLIVGTHEVSIYDAQTLDKVGAIESVVWASSMVLSADGTLLATADNDGVALWEVGSWSQVRTLPGSRGTSSLSFSPDGKLLASATGSTVKLWDVAGGSDLQTIPAGDLTVIAFSPDGLILAVAVRDKVELWRVADWSNQATLEGHTNRMTGLAFSPDGSLLASSSDDGTARIWDVATGRQKRALLGHTQRVSGVAFSPDGRLLATSSWDLTIRLWDVASGQELRSLTGHSGGIYCVAFSPDGATLVSGAVDGAVRLWGIAP